MNNQGQPSPSKTQDHAEEKVVFAESVIQRWRLQNLKGEEIDQYLSNLSKKFMKYKLNIFLLNKYALQIQHWYYKKQSRKERPQNQNEQSKKVENKHKSKKSNDQAKNIYGSNRVAPYIQKQANLKKEKSKQLDNQSKNEIPLPCKNQSINKECKEQVKSPKEQPLKAKDSANEELQIVNQKQTQQKIEETSQPVKNKPEIKRAVSSRTSIKKIENSESQTINTNQEIKNLKQSIVRPQSSQKKEQPEQKELKRTVYRPQSSQKSSGQQIPVKTPMHQTSKVPIQDTMKQYNSVGFKSPEQQFTSPNPLIKAKISKPNEEKKQNIMQKKQWGVRTHSWKPADFDSVQVLVDQAWKETDEQLKIGKPTHKEKSINRSSKKISKESEMTAIEEEKVVATFVQEGQKVEAVTYKLNKQEKPKLEKNKKKQTEKEKLQWGQRQTSWKPADFDCVQSLVEDAWKHNEDQLKPSKDSKQRKSSARKPEGLTKIEEEKPKQQKEKRDYSGRPKKFVEKETSSPLKRKLFNDVETKKDLTEEQLDALVQATQNSNLDRKEFIHTGQSQHDEISIFGSSNGSPLKKFRRTRDERKKVTNIGKKENQNGENAIVVNLSPVKASLKDSIISTSKENILTESMNFGSVLVSPQLNSKQKSCHKSSSKKIEPILSASKTNKVLQENITNKQ